MNRLSQEISLGIALLLTLQLLISFTAIGLFARMTPAIQGILQDDLEAVEAGEQLLVAVARADPSGPTLSSLRRWIHPLRERASDPQEGLPSEQAPQRGTREGRLLDQAEALAPAVAAGDLPARERFVEIVQALTAIHRARMRQKDQVALQRGSGGAWSAALLGIAAFGAGLLVHRRLRGRLELPILEIDAALTAGLHGDPHRRAVHRPGAEELHRIVDHLNQLLDQVQRRRAQPEDPHLRAALLHLMDALDAPTALIHDGEEVIALNLAAVRLWDDDQQAGQISQLLRDEPTDRWHPAHLTDGLTLWTRSPEPEPEPDQ